MTFLLKKKGVLYIYEVQLQEQDKTNAEEY